MELVENSMLGQLLEPGAEVSALARSLSTLQSVSFVLKLSVYCLLRTYLMFSLVGEVFFVGYEWALFVFI